MRLLFEKLNPTIFCSFDNLEIKMQGKDFIVFNSNTLSSSHATAKDGLKCNNNCNIDDDKLDTFVRHILSDTFVR